MEHPILFTGEMVRALLDGRKTQTRRVNPARYLKWKKGDRLWVRESWQACGWKCPNGYKYGYTIEPRIKYIADGHERDLPRPGTPTPSRGWFDNKIRPSIHMPRWASRITLELTEDVRVERVQEITEDDTDKEGIDYWEPFERHETKYCRRYSPDYDLNGVVYNPGGCDCSGYTMGEIFGLLWDSINAKRGYSWASNPEVAVITFRHIDGNESANVAEEG